MVTYSLFNLKTSNLNVCILLIMATCFGLLVPPVMSFVLNIKAVAETT